jgi:hypothetical protein
MSLWRRTALGSHDIYSDDMMIRRRLPNCVWVECFQRRWCANHVKVVQGHRRRENILKTSSPHHPHVWTRSIIRLIKTRNSPCARVSVVVEFHVWKTWAKMDYPVIVLHATIWTMVYRRALEIECCIDEYEPGMRLTRIPQGITCSIYVIQIEYHCKDVTETFRKMPFTCEKVDLHSNIKCTRDGTSSRSECSLYPGWRCAK